MKRLSIIFSFCIILILTSCKTNASSNQENNDDFDAATFVISSYEGGGMIPVDEKVLISKEESHWIYNRYGKETVVSWNTSEEELKTLYQFFKKHNYSKIESRSEGEVFDRGGLTINIEMSGTETEINNSGSYFISEKWMDDYKAIKKKLNDFVNTKIYENKLRVAMSTTVNVQEAIDLYEISVFVDEEKGLDTESNEINPAPTFQVFEGWNKINIRAFYRDSTGAYSGKVSYQQDQIFLKATKNTQSLVLDYVNGKFVVEFKD